jgi:hypothetical protein
MGWRRKERFALSAIGEGSELFGVARRLDQNSPFDVKPLFVNLAALLCLILSQGKISGCLDMDP